MIFHLIRFNEISGLIQSLEFSIVEFFVTLIFKNIFVYGVIISIGSGVVTLQGFLIAFLGELFRVSNSNSFGLVVNLYRDHTMNLLIGGLLLNPENRLSKGAKVSAMPRLDFNSIRGFCYWLHSRSIGQSYLK